MTRLSEYRMLLPLLLVLASAFPVSAKPIEVNAVAAKVNGRVITKNQVSMMLAPIYAQLVTLYPRRGPVFEAKWKEEQDRVIQELVDRQIILDEFKQLGANIRQNAVDEEIKRQVREQFNGNEEKFREELKRSRMTMEGYRQMTREKMVVMAMRAQQFSDAAPPLPHEIQKEYNEVRMSLRDYSGDVLTYRKIFIPSSDFEKPDATPDDQLAFAEKLAASIRSEEDFAEQARLHSKDAFAEQGGMQENIPRTDLAPEFAAIVFDAPVGKVTGPLLDPRGFTLVFPIRLAPGRIPPLSEVRESIEERVRRKKSAAQYERWIESRRKSAMVEIRR